MSPEGYRDIIRAFLDGRISTRDFCREFQETLNKEPEGMDRELLLVLIDMDGAAELYSEVEIPIMIPESELREQAVSSLAKLEDYIARKGTESEQD